MLRTRREPATLIGPKKHEQTAIVTSDSHATHSLLTERVGSARAVVTSALLGRDGLRIPVEGALRRSRQGVVVDVHEPEALGVPLTPLEVVHQGPAVVAAYVAA